MVGCSLIGIGSNLVQIAGEVMPEERRQEERLNTLEITTTVMKQELATLQTDVVDHKKVMDQVVCTLNEIRIDVASAKTSIKVFCWCLSGVGTIIGVLYTISWLKIPH